MQTIVYGRWEYIEGPHHRRLMQREFALHTRTARSNIRGIAKRFLQYRIANMVGCIAIISLFETYWDRANGNSQAGRLTVSANSCGHGSAPKLTAPAQR